MAFALSSRFTAPGYFRAHSPAELAWTRAAPFNVGLWPRALSAPTAERFAQAAAPKPIAVEATVDLAFPEQARRVAARADENPAVAHGEPSTIPRTRQLL